CCLKQIVYNKSEGTVTFIDYEYGDFNYQAFDIGGHFAEHAGVDAIDYSRYPDRTFQEKWLRVYLRSWYSEMGKNPDSITDQHVADLYEKVNKFAVQAIAAFIPSHPCDPAPSKL
ncbi:PREDICTED: ethanolamine kinase 1-like, partial [Priapulus caudatus]|uniref:ethanolamine kinase n=1 Tax=Priapulus caudatus TaxID=37621 RepID=A0ABM1EVB7_PRICU